MPKNVAWSHLAQHRRHVLTAAMQASLIGVKRHVNCQRSLTNINTVYFITSSIHTKLSCVGFSFPCTFDYFTKYFMLSRNGSVFYTFQRMFHTYDKITCQRVRTCYLTN